MAIMAVAFLLLTNEKICGILCLNSDKLFKFCLDVFIFIISFLDRLAVGHLSAGRSLFIHLKLFGLFAIMIKTGGGAMNG